MAAATGIGRTIDKEIIIQASVERVFEAFTSPQALAQWWSMTEAAVDLRPGGRWSFKWVSGDEVDGVIVESDPPHHLVMDWNDGELLGVTRLTVEFSAESGGARIRLHHAGYGYSSDWDQLYDGVNTGWGQALELMRVYVEEGWTRL